MTTAADVIAVARTQVGYVETPDNITKYWLELDPTLQGQPWCGVFVSWVFLHAGYPLPAMDRPYGFIGVRDATSYAKAHGLFSQSGPYAPGDVVLYGATGGDHTGIIVSDDGTTMVTIEGNTGTADVANGGGVYENNRAHNDWVYGAFQTSKLLSKEPPMTTLNLADVSEFQGVIDWTAYGAANPAVIVRVHNSSRPDNFAAANIAGARKSCQWRGWYQYLNAGADPTAAAHALQAALGPTLPGEVMILDLEEGSGDQRARRQAWLTALQDPVEWVYSGLYFAQTHLAGVKVEWLAAYGQAEPTDSHTLWQFTNAQKFAGIANACDASVFHGTLAQLQSLTHATPSGKPVFMFTISRSCRNDFLTRMVQTRLRQLNYLGTATEPFVVDGDFGDQTARWVGLFQSRHGLASNGIVDKPTWDALFA